MSYTALSPSPIDDDTPHNPRFDEDAVSVLSSTTPISGYQAYRPPQVTATATATATPPTPTFTISSGRLPPSLVHHPISWPGIVPSRTPSQSQPPSPVPSLGFRSHLFGNRSHAQQPYDEPLAWANTSTHFHTTSTGSRPEFLTSDIYNDDDASRPVSKQYFRNPRRVRLAWSTGSVKRFPWKGVGALGIVCLLTGSAVATIFAARNTQPEAWKVFQPQTYLSVLELFMVSFTLCALAEGVVVAYWRRLLHGAPVGDMCDAWEATSLWPALKGLGKWQRNDAGVATVFSAVSLARGPLFQHALVLGNGRYDVSFVFMALGMVASFGVAAAIVPLFYGYWELGRNVSLNPLEIARAYGAPLFDGVDGNMGARGIEIERGHLTVRYGAVERNSEEKILRIEDIGRVNVRMPLEGEVFG